MGRDRKPSLSLVSSFSLPSLSLSRPKATPSLAPLDTSRANPLDTDSSTSSFIQPISSVSGSSASPLKPPNSPGNSVPLPSIRSLRNRFSFSAQEPPNLPSTLQTPTNKRVSSRRFLPFGNSTPTNQPPDNTPSIPRKSLGDVFALGRASTSSRFDSSSARSVTPSGRSSRSVTSAATMRGSVGWNLNSSLAPPNSAASRPRSDDFSALGVDLGYVITIGSGDETIRRRPDFPLADPLESTPTVDESSQEDISLSSLGTISAGVGVPTAARLGETLPISTATVTSNLYSSVANQPASINPRRLSPVPPISIPPFSGISTTGSRLEGSDAPEKGGTVQVANFKGVNVAFITPVTEIDLDVIELDSSRADFPFTPVDDRSDVTSSTNNTPHSGHRSLRKLSQTMPPPLPSPSPQTAATSVGGFPFCAPQGQPSTAHDRSPGKHTLLELSEKRGTQDISRVGYLARQLRDNAVAGVPNLGQGASSTKTDIESNPPSSSTLGLVGGAPHAAPRSEALVCSYTGSGSRELPSGQAERLLPSRNSPRLNGEPLAVPSFPNSEHSGVKGGQQSYDLPILANKLEVNESQLAQQAHQERKNAGFSSSLDHDLAKRLSPHQSDLLPSLSTPERDRSHDTYQTPAPSHLPSQSGPLTPQAQSSPSHRPGSRLQQNVTTPSPSVTSFRPNDLLSARAPIGIQRRDSADRNAISANNTPLLSPTKLADYSYPREQATTPNNPSRLTPWRSPSTGATIARKRSASFDLTGSSLVHDSNDPFATQLNGTQRTDWLGPRTAKAFAAAGLLDKDKERTNSYSGVRSETPNHRGLALNSWRTHGERGGGGSIRSHSRLGSEIISPSFRTRSLVGGDSSPSYGRSSLDYTAPPSPVSTHRTLVSNATSSSQSHQSALQALRERHELETEALLLALAGSKRAERDLRAENEELVAHVAKLVARVAMLEAEKEQHERTKSRAWDRPWNSHAALDVELLDRRRQDILLGRPPRRGWDASGRVNLSRSSSRSGAHGVHLDTPRSASAASLRRSSEDTQHRGLSPKFPNSPNVPVSAPITPLSRSSTLLGAGETPPREPEVSMTETEFEDWNESSFGQALQSSPRMGARHRLSSTSVTSLLPQMPGSMSMLVHEQPGGISFEEDEVSFGSTSPSSLTLVHPRSNTPKPAPANISPITADFSFNSIPGSPRSLRLRPEEEMHLADLISLQGLEITDVIANLEQ